MDQIIIRTVTPADAEALLDIYAEYVRHTAISFEYEVPTLAEFRGRIVHTLEKYPYLCIQRGEEILGYAYAGPFHPRAAYQWSAETTIYLKREAQKQGLGKRLYGALEQALKDMGILNLYACIGVPEVEDEYLTNNSASFHARCGFTRVGLFRQCGYKFGRWYHMVYMEKIIGAHT
jgi:phosphinothricin acetyltransferase